MIFELKTIVGDEKDPVFANGEWEVVCIIGTMLEPREGYDLQLESIEIDLVTDRLCDTDCEGNVRASTVAHEISECGPPWEVNYGYTEEFEKLMIERGEGRRVWGMMKVKYSPASQCGFGIDGCQEEDVEWDWNFDTQTRVSPDGRW